MLASSDAPKLSLAQLGSGSSRRPFSSARVNFWTARIKKISSNKLFLVFKILFLEVRNFWAIFMEIKIPKVIWPYSEDLETYNYTKLYKPYWWI